MQITVIPVQDQDNPANGSLKIEGGWSGHPVMLFSGFMDIHFTHLILSFYLFEVFFALLCLCNKWNDPKRNEK